MKKGKAANTRLVWPPVIGQTVWIRVAYGASPLHVKIIGKLGGHMLSVRYPDDHSSIILLEDCFATKEQAKEYTSLHMAWRKEKGLI